jgi:hypothetical protein
MSLLKGLEEPIIGVVGAHYTDWRGLLEGWEGLLEGLERHMRGIGEAY